MIIYVVVVFFLLLAGGRPRIRGLHENYLSKENTDAVRGIFILLIFLSHFVQYLDPLTQPWDVPYGRLRAALGQAVVTLFFYYSGYGVALSADKKGENYVRHMPTRRILPTLLTYDCSALLYLILQMCRGINITFGQFVQTMLAWKGVGNSTWYIFVILALYTITWLVLCKRPMSKSAAMAITTCCVTLVLAFMSMGMGQLFYDTLLCYPLGVWHYVYKEKIDTFLSKRGINYIAVAGCAAVLFAVFHKVWKVNILCYMMTMLLFAICVVLFTMKFEIKNPILIYCGKHLAGLYLLQRIPMILLQDFFDTGSESPQRYLYLVLSLALTLLLDAVFTRWIRFMGIGKNRHDELRNER